MGTNSRTLNLVLGIMFASLALYNIASGQIGQALIWSGVAVTLFAFMRALGKKP